MSEYRESYPRVILIVWTFPDLPIVEGEKEESVHMGISSSKTIP